MPHTKSAQYHVEIEPTATSAPEWGVQIREDVTGAASIHVYGMTRDEAIDELHAAATALAVDRPPHRSDV
jgi:hypothetical protein